MKLFLDDFPIEPRFKEGVLEEINSEGFTPKQFSSTTKEKKFKNIVIDINADTIQVPAVADVPSGSESIFHSSVIYFFFSIKIKNFSEIPSICKISTLCVSSFLDNDRSRSQI